MFVASNLPTAYPYKLQKPATVTPAVRDTAEVFIIDSGIGNDDMTNRDVLDLAHEYDADYVIAKDYLHDQPRTTESIIMDFIPNYERHPCEATPMIPLQPPHASHYCRIQNQYRRQENGRDFPYTHYVLGGMAFGDVSDDDVMRYVKEFRRAAPGVYAHALGIGGGRNLLSRLHGTGLLDSIDCATPEMAAVNGCVLDNELRQTEVRIMNGDGARRRNIPLAEFNSWQVHDAWNGGYETEGQTRFGEFDHA